MVRATRTMITSLSEGEGIDTQKSRVSYAVAMSIVYCYSQCSISLGSCGRHESRKALAVDAVELG